MLILHENLEQNKELKIPAGVRGPLRGTIIYLASRLRYIEQQSLPITVNVPVSINLIGKANTGPHINQPQVYALVHDDLYGQTLDAIKNIIQTQSNSEINEFMNKKQEAINELTQEIQETAKRYNVSAWEIYQYMRRTIDDSPLGVWE